MSDIFISVLKYKIAYKYGITKMKFGLKFQSITSENRFMFGNQFVFVINFVDR